MTDAQRDMTVLVALCLSFLEVVVGVTAIVVSKRTEPDEARIRQATVVRGLLIKTIAFFLTSEIVVSVLSFPLSEIANVWNWLVFYIQSLLLAVLVFLIFLKSKCSPRFALLHGGVLGITLIVLVYFDVLTHFGVSPKTEFFSQVNRVAAHLMALIVNQVAISCFMFLLISIRIFIQVAMAYYDDTEPVDKNGANRKTPTNPPLPK